MWKRLVALLLFVSFAPLPFFSEDSSSGNGQSAQLTKKELLGSLNLYQKISETLATELEKQIPLSEKRQTELSSLKTELTQVNDKLSQASEALKTSKEDLSTAQSLLNDALNSLAKVKKDFEDYKKLSGMQLEKSNKRGDIWKAVAITSSVVAVLSIVANVILVKYGKTLLP